MTQDTLDLIPNEKVFAPRPPEEAPLWLILLCAGIIIGIWIITFVAIWRL